MEASRNDVLKKIINDIKGYVLMMVTIPWLVPTSFWLFTTITIVILESDPKIKLGQLIPGDFTNFFTYLLSWIIASILYIISSVLHYVWNQQNRPHAVLSIYIIMLLMVSYWFLLWPEIDLFLRLRQ